MKTINPLTPEQAGLTLAVVSGPRGQFEDNWQGIEYTCELSDARRRVFWSGPYRLGIGHVKIKQHDGDTWGWTVGEKSMLEVWRNKPHANFVNKQLQADVAAKLAKIQKVAPTLDQVMSSLLMDGSAFFDGQTFEDWCSELGYDTDSRKAEKTYRECDETGRKIAKAVSRDQLEGLREWARNQ